MYFKGKHLVTLLFYLWIIRLGHVLPPGVHGGDQVVRWIRIWQPSFAQLDMARHDLKIINTIPSRQFKLITRGS